MSSLQPLALLSPVCHLQQIHTLLQQGPMALIGLPMVGIGCHLAALKLSERRMAWVRRLALPLALAVAMG